jgi:predicted MFS family arabinose efflux permease
LNLGLFAPFAVLRQPGVARLWGIGVLAGVIRWLEVLAYAIAALDLTGSPFAAAATVLLRMVPQLLLSLPIAALAEGRDPGGLLRAGLVAMALVSAGLLAAAALGAVGIVVLLAAALVSGSFSALEGTLRRSMMAQAGGTARIGAAIGLDTATNHLTRGLGAIAGGAVLATIGLTGAFAAGLVAYSAAALIVPGPAARGGPRPAVGTGLLQGLRQLLRDRTIVGIVLVTVVFNLFGFPYIALVPVMGEAELGLGPVAIGALLATEAAGGVLGSLAIALWAPRAWFRRVYTGGCMLFVVAVLGFATLGPSPIGLVMLLAAGLGIAGFGTMQTILPLETASPELRLRAFGLVMTSIGVSPFGFAYAGLLGELLGGSAGLRALAVQGMLATALVVVWCPALLGRHTAGAQPAQ